MPTLDFEEFKSGLASHSTGVHILGAPSRWIDWIATDSGQRERLITFATALFDYVIVDTPSSGPEIDSALAVADIAVVVTSMDMASAKNTAILVGALCSEAVQGNLSPGWLVVANHVSPISSLGPQDLASVAGLEPLWEVPHDPALYAAMELGQPITITRPRSPAGKNLRALPRRLVQEPARIDRRQEVRGSGITAPEVTHRLQLALARAGLGPASAAPSGTAIYLAGSGPRGGAYHLPRCHLGGRIRPARRMVVPLPQLPLALRPCRVCKPSRAA